MKPELSVIISNVEEEHHSFLVMQSLSLEEYAGTIKPFLKNRLKEPGSEI